MVHVYQSLYYKFQSIFSEVIHFFPNIMMICLTYASSYLKASSIIIFMQLINIYSMEIKYLWLALMLILLCCLFCHPEFDMFVMVTYYIKLLFTLKCTPLEISKEYLAYFWPFLLNPIVNRVMRFMIFT